MSIKLYDSELKVMEVLWSHGDLPARQIADLLEVEVGWNVNTTYTVIKKCIAKGAIRRSEPRFRCHALVTKAEVQASETEELLGRLFDGSPDLLFASLLSSKRLTPEQLRRLAERIAEAEGRQ